MDGYKRIISSQKKRFAILYALRHLPDKWMLKLQYRIKFKRKLNLKQPKRFTEKIQWYKLYYKNELMPVCSDKYAVREYIKEKGLSHILIDLHGVFDKPEDISFEQLPEKFVLKLSNGSGTNLICRDKNKLNLADVVDEFKWFEYKVKANAGREWPYMKAKPVIIAERLLEDKTHVGDAPNDYKIFCYDGKPTYIICISDRYSDKCNHLVYDTDWNKIRVASEGARIEEDAAKPDNLQEMLDIAAKLSEDFPFARIDLYSLHGKTYFGEITFYPWSGYMEFEPEEFDYILGEKFTCKLK